MKIRCNIGRRGRLLRGFIGLVFLFDAYMMFRWNIPGRGIGSQLLQVLVAGMGLFSIFEAVVGWCAIRALGNRKRF